MLDPKKIILTQIFEGGGGGGDVDVEPLSVTENGEYTADEGKAYSPVSVSVPNSYSAGDEGKVVSNGALVSQTSDTATQNGTVDTTLINSLTVNVSGGGGASNIVTGTFTETTVGEATIPLSYQGSGFPILIAISAQYPSLGSSSYNMCVDYLFSKNNSDTPDYHGENGAYAANRGYHIARTTYGSSFGTNNGTAYVFDSGGTGTGFAGCVKMANASTLAVKLNTADSQANCFITNVAYNYVILYSS